MLEQDGRYVFRTPSRSPPPAHLSRADGSETCTYCAGINKPCTYEPIRKGPPKTYVESLENRMEAMEELL
jgi:hypothetical protein